MLWLMLEPTKTRLRVLFFLQKQEERAGGLIDRLYIEKLVGSLCTALAFVFFFAERKREQGGWVVSEQR